MTDVISVASVSFDESSNAYKLDWDFEDKAQLVDIYVSSHPEAGDRTQIATGENTLSFTWAPDAEVDARNYFHIAPAVGLEHTVATRVLPLEGGRNFRDMGGYKTEDGRRVKWGKLFRSGVMHELTASDYDYLGDLGIKVVCDLRTAAERFNEPTDWAAGDIEYLSFADPAREDANPLVAVFSDPDVTPDKVRETMLDLYPNILEQQAPAYRRMFDELAKGAVPLAFNCSAGKDRTGVGAALILSALGVPRETIIADYEMSEKVVDFMAAYRIRSQEPVEADSPYSYLRQMPPEVVAPLMRSDPVYLETLLDRVDAEHGSVEAYIQTSLDVEPEEIEFMRAELLH